MKNSKLDESQADLDDAALSWTCKAFSALSNVELYQIMAARSAVFVVEQNCVYQDADFADLDCYHLSAWLPCSDSDKDVSATLAAYVRLVPPGLKFAEASIGRVLTSQVARRRKLGAILMTRAISECHALFEFAPIRIGAQQYLEHFYRRLGFVTVSDRYDEDGIPHIEMLRPAAAITQSD